MGQYGVVNNGKTNKQTTQAEKKWRSKLALGIWRKKSGAPSVIQYILYCCTERFYAKIPLPNLVVARCDGMGDLG